MKREYRIVITETDASVRAVIFNPLANAKLTIEIARADYDTRDEMIGNLFTGPLPNIRDCFDSYTWVSEPTTPETWSAQRTPGCQHCGEPHGVSIPCRERKG